jgi:transposase
VCDLVRSLGIELQVASTNDERWQWRKVKTKNDRADALKLAQFSARNELNLVHVPQSEMRQLIHSLGQDISVLDFVFHTRFVMLP